MKNASLILSIVALLAAAAFGIILFTSDKETTDKSAESAAVAPASQVDIVYIQLDRILQEYDMDKPHENQFPVYQLSP